MTIRTWRGAAGQAPKCPHRDAIQYCPLYVASHTGNGNGCAFGPIEDGRCAVDRGLDYRKACERMAEREPELFAQVVQAGLVKRLGVQRSWQ